MSNGKGDSPRNCFSHQFRENYDHIFRRKPSSPPFSPSNKLDKISPFPLYIRSTPKGGTKSKLPV